VDDDVGDAHGRAKLPQTQRAARGFFLMLAKPGSSVSPPLMQRLLTLFTFCFLVIGAPAAEQWRSDRFRCTLTFPEGETWVQSTPAALPAGEMVYLANHTLSKQSVAVIVIPKIPNNDLENPSVVNRIMEPLIALGFQVINHAPVTLDGQPFLQLAGRRGESATVSIICVARAALRDGTLYIAMTTGRGDEELTSDKHFLRVLNTFTLLDAAAPTDRVVTGALAVHYRQAYKAAFASVGGLLVLALLGFILSRRPA
jgi:hypothetical protein